MRSKKIPLLPAFASWMFLPDTIELDLAAAGIVACLHKPVQQTRLLNRLVEVMQEPVVMRAKI